MIIKWLTLLSFHLLRKKDIGVNEIKTLDGITIRLSNQERIVIADTIN